MALNGRVGTEETETEMEMETETGVRGWQCVAVEEAVDATVDATVAGVTKYDRGGDSCAGR